MFTVGKNGIFRKFFKPLKRLKHFVHRYLRLWVDTHSKKFVNFLLLSKAPRKKNDLLKDVENRVSPASTRRLYNVISTSMQRHDVALTLRRLCNVDMCLLGECLNGGTREVSLLINNIDIISFLHITYVSYWCSLEACPLSKLYQYKEKLCNMSITSSKRRTVRGL